uniref:Large subunit ribosomal protein L19 n=1 Tax=Tetraselmis sp. GSL018 TaxID=582737 RepID=A0A061SAM8_9CHLO
MRSRITRNFPFVLQKAESLFEYLDLSRWNALSATRSSSTTSVPNTTQSHLGAREQKAAELGLKYQRGVSQPPWTPTNELFKRKSYFKRMAFLVQVSLPGAGLTCASNSKNLSSIACLDTQELEKEEVVHRKAEKLALEDFKPGDVLAVTVVTPENRRRETVAKGVCIAINNAGPRTSFTIRNAYGNEGFEQHFPLYSPNVRRVEVLERGKVRRVRRAKLYYLRDRAPKEYRVS